MRGLGSRLSPADKIAKGQSGKAKKSSVKTEDKPECEERSSASEGSGEESGGEKYVHCALLGDGMVGKTCLTLSYTQHVFTDRYTATVFDNYPVAVSVGGQEFVVSVFDTAGQRDYESVRAYTYHSSEVLVLCFSVCERESFYSVVNCWLPEIQRHTKGKRPLLLVGTQIDLRTSSSSSPSSSSGLKSSTSSSSLSSSFSDLRVSSTSDLRTSSSSSSSTTSSVFSMEDEVSTEEGNQLAKMIGADCYIECSAQNQEGVRQVFEHVVFSALKYRKKKSKILGKLFTGKPLSSKALRRAACSLNIPATNTEDGWRP